MPGRPGATDDATATRPCSSRSSRSPSGRSRRPSAGTSRRRASTPHRHLVEFRGASEAVGRRDRHGRGLRARRQGQGRRHRHRQGLRRARSSATTSAAARRRTARTTSASRARSALGDAVARLQGHEDGRPDGRQARARRSGSPCTTVDAEQNLLLVKGAVPGPKNGIVEIREEERHGRAEGTRARRRRQGVEGRHARGGRLRRRGEAASRARDRARRAERAPRRARAARRAAGSSPAAARSRGARRAPAAPAPGTIRAPQFTGGGVAFPPSPRSFDVKVNRRRAAPRCARRSRRTRGDGTLGVVDAPAFDEPSTKHGCRAARARGARSGRSLVVVAEDEENVVKSFRNLERVVVVVPSELEVAARRLGARARSSPRRALERRRSGGPVMSLAPDRDPARAGGLGEELQPDRRDRKYTFRVHKDAHKTQVRQAVEELFEVKVDA